MLKMLKNTLLQKCRIATQLSIMHSERFLDLLDGRVFALSERSLAYSLSMKLLRYLRTNLFVLADLTITLSSRGGDASDVWRPNVFFYPSEMSLFSQKHNEFQGVTFGTGIGCL